MKLPPSSTLGCPVVLCLSVFFSLVCMIVLSPPCAVGHSHIVLNVSITLTRHGEDYELRMSVLHSWLPHPNISSQLCQNIFLVTFFSILSIGILPWRWEILSCPCLKRSKNMVPVFLSFIFSVVLVVVAVVVVGKTKHSAYFAFNTLRIGSICELFWAWYWTLWFGVRPGISWATDRSWRWQ